MSLSPLQTIFYFPFPPCPCLPLVFIFRDRSCELDSEVALNVSQVLSFRILSLCVLPFSITILLPPG